MDTLDWLTNKIDTRLMSVDFDIADDFDNQALINQGMQGDDDEEAAIKYDY